MHAGRREPPRQPLEQRVGARRRLDAGVRRLRHLFILIGYAYHTKLSEEERKDKCAPCRAALLTVTNRDSATMDEAEQALGLKASKD